MKSNGTSTSVRVIVLNRFAFGFSVALPLLEYFIVMIREPHALILPHLINKVAHVTADNSHRAIILVTFPRHARLSPTLFTQMISWWETLNTRLTFGHR